MTVVLERAIEFAYENRVRTEPVLGRNNEVGVGAKWSGRKGVLLLLVTPAATLDLTWANFNTLLGIIKTDVAYWTITNPIAETFNVVLGRARAQERALTSWRVEIDYTQVDVA